jgi:hypothetical protein
MSLPGSIVLFGLVKLTITTQVKRIHQLAQESPRAEEPDVLHDEIMLIEPVALVRADLVTECPCEEPISSATIEKETTQGIIRST